MQKIALTTLVTSLILAGCGGGSSGSSTTNQTLPATATINDNNALRVLTEKGELNGEIFENTIKLNAETTAVKFYASANEPVSFVEIYPKGQMSMPAGWIYLYPDQPRAKIDFLAAPRDGQKSMVVLCRSGSCEQNTNYSLNLKDDIYTLNIRFDKSMQVWNGLLPDSFYPDRHYYHFNSAPDFNGIPGGYIVYGMSAPVQLDGQLNYTIPKQWAVMQQNRFPEIAIAGQLTFDGELYQFVGSHGGTLKNLEARTLQLKSSQGKEISIMLANHTTASDGLAKGTYVVVYADSKSYEGHLDLSQQVFLENSQRIQLDFRQLSLADAAGEHKVLNSNLVVPKAYAQLKLNNTALSLGGYNPDMNAFARDDQKGYKFLLNSGDQAYTLTVIHEAKGHVSVQYQNGNLSLSCGSPAEACTGLSVDADQKTYRFKQVKLDSNHVLNGRLFVPGVY